MNRYLKAFIFTLFIYIVVIVSYIYFTKNCKVSSSSKQSLQRVNITIITPKPKPKFKPPQKKIIKKIKKPIKKIVKKIKKKIIKKIIKTQKQKKVLKAKNKEIIKKIKKEQKPIPKQQIKQKISKSKVGVTKENNKNIELKKQKYFNLIKSKIIKNKTYPKRAIRRGIQGFIKVKFIVSKDGKLLDIKIIDGKKIFFKSVKKAIEYSFPTVPPKGIFNNQFSLDIKLVYKL